MFAAPSLDHLVRAQQHGMQGIERQPRDGAGRVSLAGEVRAEATGMMSFASCRTGPMMNYREIITIEPGKRGGKPCIRDR